MTAAPALDISRLMRPRSIAIVGISPEPSSAGFLALRNLEDFGYSGAVHLVSRNQTNIGNRTCVRAIDDLPEGIDAAMLFIPRAAIEDAVAACARRGVGGVVTFAAGFAEAGGQWQAAQERIAATARAAGLALCGPNCLGIVDFAHGVPLTFARQIGRREQVSSGAVVIAQSGGLASIVRAALTAKGVAVVCTVSTGNEAVLGLEDYAAYLLEDPATKLVVAFAEQIRKPQRFLAMAVRARELGKPVVLLLSGHSAAARESAKSHTGALAGDYAVIEALLRHNCVMLVQSLEELFDVAELALHFSAPPSKGLAMVTDSGAIKGLALDYCETLGARFAAAVSRPRGNHSGRTAGFRQCLQTARPHCASNHPSGNVQAHHQAPAGRRRLRQPAARRHHRGSKRFRRGQGQGMPRAADGIAKASRPRIAGGRGERAGVDHFRRACGRDPVLLLA